MTTKLPEKGTLENIVLGFDFSRESASVSNPTFIVTVEAGVDASPDDLIYGSSEIGAVDTDGNPILPALVKQRVAGGLDQVNYRVQCTVTSIEGDTLTCAVILPVRLKL